MKLKSLLDVLKIDVDIELEDEEICGASFIANTKLTNRGKEHFKEVLNSEVVEIIKVNGTVTVIINDCASNELRDFLSAASGDIPESLFNKWFK